MTDSSNQNELSTSTTRVNMRLPDDARERRKLPMLHLGNVLDDGTLFGCSFDHLGPRPVPPNGNQVEEENLQPPLLEGRTE